MTIPAHTANPKIAHPNPSESTAQAAVGDFHSRHRVTNSFIGDASNPLAVFDPSVLPLPEPEDLASTEKTRGALLKLCESPRDTFALTTLGEENHLSIENELRRHLHVDSNSALRQQLLSRLVWHARFFCDEIDEPKAWVARSANLEARRLALKLFESR